MNRIYARLVTSFAVVLFAAVGLALAGNAIAAGHVRHVSLEGVANFRDLGGYTTPDGKQVRWGLLFRSDALDSLTAADMKTLAQLNVASITDFRSSGEVARRADNLPAGLEGRYRHLPLEDPLVAADAEFVKALELTDEEAKLATIDRLIVDHYYPRFVRDGRAAYGRWLRSLLEGPRDSARIFHCTGGADRTGFAAAIVLLALGVPREQILEDYLLTNNYLFSSAGVALLRSKGVTAMPSGYRLQKKYLEASFKAMEHDYGSIDNYLRQGLGIDEVLKNELRARYLEPAGNPAPLPVLQRFADPRPIVVAHRGCWRRTAENSLAGLKSCIDRNIDAAEIDIRMTRDGALILMHDERLDRTTPLTGAVSEVTLAEVAGARLREGEAKPGARLTNESVPTLSHALRLAKGRLILYLDIKCRNCEEAVAKEVEAEGAQDWVVFGGRMDNQPGHLPAWATRQRVTWINDCEWARRFTQLQDCFKTFADGVKHFEKARLFLSMSLEPGFYTDIANDPQLRAIKPIVGAYLANGAELSDEAALAESKRQWTLFLKAGSPAIIGDFPDEMLELMHSLGKR